MDLDKCEKIAIAILNLENESKGDGAKYLLKLNSLEIDNVVRAFSSLMLKKIVTPNQLQDIFKNLPSGYDRSYQKIELENNRSEILKNIGFKSRYSLIKLDKFSSNDLYQMLKNENITVSAVVLSVLQREKAAKLLSLYSDHKRMELVLRVLALDEVSTELLDESIESVLNIWHNSLKNRSMFEDDRKMSFVASVLQHMDEADSDRVLDGLAAKNVEIFDVVKEALFDFEKDILSMNPHDIRVLYSQFRVADWAIALKCISEERLEKFQKDLSANQRSHLLDEMSLSQKVLKTEQRKIRLEVIKKAQELSDLGKVTSFRTKEKWIS